MPIKRFARNILLAASLWMLQGCSSEISSTVPNFSSTPVSDSVTSSSSYEETEDLVSDSFSLEYYRTTELANSLEGMLLIQKKASFDDSMVSISVYYGNQTGILDGYDAIKVFDDLKSSELECDFRKNALIPTSCTKIWVIGKDTSSNIISKATFDVGRYKKQNTLKYEFQVISDQQISTSSPCFYRRSKKAFEDIRENSPSSELIVVNGDIVDEAKAENYDSFYDSYSSVYQNEETKLAVGLGNHEFIIQNEDPYYTGVSQEELTQRYETRLSLWKNKTGNQSPYFSMKVKGSSFIFLGTTKMPGALDGNTRADATLGEEQLAWFKTQVDEAKRTGNPIYVFSHGSLRDTVDGSLTSKNQTWYGYKKEEEDEIRKVIDGIDNLFFFSSHSHWSFENGTPYLAQDDGASFFNTAAVGYLWEGNGNGHSYKNGSYENGGGQGLYVEVYDDQVFIRGRQFEAADSISRYWYSDYQVVMPI